MKFNKKNMYKFGNKLYSIDESGNEHYIPLCRHTQARSNGKIIRCALSELYEYIMREKTARKLTKAEKKMYTYQLPDYDESFPYFDLSNNVVIFTDEDELAADLVTNAEMKTSAQPVDLVYALSQELPQANDSIAGYTEKALIRRAKKVQSKVYQIAEKYLK